MDQFIQGDVMFRRRAQPLKLESMNYHLMINERLEPVKPVDGKYILAHGEKTGHTHVADALAVQLFQIGSDRIVRVTAPTFITHDEHDALALEPGDYDIVMQRQYVAPDIEVQRAKFD